MKKTWRMALTQTVMAAGILTLPAIPFLRAAQSVDPSKGLVLSNKIVRFEFEPQGLGLSAAVDLASGRNHIRAVEGKHLLWEVSFARGTQIRKIDNNYKPCNHIAVEKLANGTQTASLEWNDLRWWLEDRVVTIRATVELPADSGIARWRIFVDNRSDYWGLWAVAFPLLNGFPASGEYDVARPTFGSGGHLLKAWADNFEVRYPSGNWPVSGVVIRSEKLGPAKLKVIQIEPAS